MGLAHVAAPEGATSQSSEESISPASIIRQALALYHKEPVPSATWHTPGMPHSQQPGTPQVCHTLCAEHGVPVVHRRDVLCAIALVLAY